MQKNLNFFLFASGADIQTLNQCPSEKNKYIGIGGTVFFTGLFAALAAGYALYTVFDNYFIAIAAGLIWGLMIFNLDRYIVSSLRKEERWWREWLSALPRILLAVIISVVIARPLELKIFSKEIEAELIILEQQVYKAQETEARQRFEPNIEQLKTSVTILQKEIESKTLYRNELVQLAQQEADGTGGSKIKNPGPIYKIKKANADEAETELQQLIKINQSKIKELEIQSQQIENKMNNALQELPHSKLNGPAARLEALDRITTASNTVWWAHLFIMFLFIILETTPILVKLFSKQGPYDSLINTLEHNFRCEQIKSIALTSADARKKAASLEPTEQNYINRKLDAELL